MAYCARAWSIRHEHVSFQTSTLNNYTRCTLFETTTIGGLYSNVSLWRFMSLLWHAYEKYVVKDVTLLLYSLVFVSGWLVILSVYLNTNWNGDSLFESIPQFFSLEVDQRCRILGLFLAFYPTVSSDNMKISVGHIYNGDPYTWQYLMFYVIRDTSVIQINVRCFCIYLATFFQQSRLLCSGMVIRSIINRLYYDRLQMGC
jgi:hypothetical protein